MGTKEQLDLLLLLQEIDVDIDSLESDKLAIPEMLEGENLKIKQQDEEISNIKKQLGDLQKNRKLQELELESKKGVLKKLQSQLYEVKTNKEYTAMQEELRRAKDDISKIEEEILKIMLEEDQYNAKIKQEQEKLKGLQTELKVMEGKCGEELKKVEEQLNEKNKSKNELVVKIEPKVITKYEKIRKVKQGVAVSKVIDSICSECHLEIRPQLLIELNKYEDLVLCENCSRILVDRREATVPK